MIGSLLAGAIGSAGGFFGDMLRKKTSMSDAANNVSDAMGKLSPQALALQKDAGINASFSRAGTTGADVAKEFNKRYSQFGNLAGPQETAALENIKRSGQNAIANLGKGWEFASKNAADTGRANRRMAREAMLATGPAGADAIFSRLGEADSNNLSNMYGQSLQAAQTANQIFGDSESKYLSGLIGAKQANYALNVAPWEMQRDTASEGLLGSTMAQGLGMAADQAAVIGSNPLGFLETAGGYAMGQGLNNYFGTGTLKRSEGSGVTTDPVKPVQPYEPE